MRRYDSDDSFSDFSSSYKEDLCEDLPDFSTLKPFFFEPELLKEHYSTCLRIVKAVVKRKVKKKDRIGNNN